MTQCSTRLLGVFAATALLAQTAYGDILSARNAGMGGAGVASSRFDAASVSNPALLTRKKAGDDVAIVMPSAGVEFSDKDEARKVLKDLEDKFDESRDLIRAISNAATLAEANAAEARANALRDEVVADLKKISGNEVTADLGATLAIAVPSDNIAYAFDTRAQSHVTAVVNYDAGDEIILTNAITSRDTALVDTVQSTAEARVAVVNELALSLAKKFDLAQGQLGLGLTPKMQTVQTFFYQQTANNTDASDITANDYVKKSNAINLDLGAAWYYSEGLTAGFTVKNLLAKNYKTKRVNGEGDTYQLGTLATVGGAYQNRFVNLALDVDLMPTKYFKSEKDSQFVRAGVELNVYDWVQFRLGTRVDSKGSRENVNTYGLNLSPFDVVHFGVTLIDGGDNTMGGVMDLKLLF